jgi:anti-sigma regulatory factor (Ser/Thr protein kinase)
MREDAVADLLARTGLGWPVVEELVQDGLLARREHGGRTFFVRRFARPVPGAAGGPTPGRVR